MMLLYLHVYRLKNHSHKIQYTLFGNYVDELNIFIATGEVYNVVVVVQLTKVKLFQG